MFSLFAFFVTADAREVSSLIASRKRKRGREKEMMNLSGFMIFGRAQRGPRQAVESCSCWAFSFVMQRADDKDIR